MYKVGGFAELLPEYKILEEKILDIVKKSYKKYGYTPIETPAFELNEVLTAKGGGEVNNQIFGVYGLAQGSDDLKDYSLRFDLTVPFSRYVLDYRGELTFPFKRSQIGKVWRGERQQRGRSKEFYQADIDVIWQDDESNTKSYLFYDAECIFVVFNTLKEIFKEFNLDTSSKININNRKIISGFITSLGLLEKLEQISIVIDKVDKITEEQFKKDLERLEIGENEINKIFKFIKHKVGSDNISFIGENFGVENEEFLSGVKELSKVLTNLELLGLDSNNIVVNLSIVRGLGYYTGTVFETFIDGDRKLGSIGSGGRYEKLTTFIDPKTSYSGVGFSLGITRLEEYLFEKQDKEKLQKTTSDYLVVNFETTFNESIKLFKKLISKGKSVEIYPESDKLQKQFKYADKKGIRYVVILGEDELKNGKYILKDMFDGSSEEIIL